jgi:hypothetical protein
MVCGVSKSINLHKCLISRLPYTFITSDVAEATCVCMLAQAEDAERTRQPPVIHEKVILEEFGRCLMQIIESANRTKGWAHH